MASSVYEDDSSDSNLSQDYALNYCDSFNSQESAKETNSSTDYLNNVNVIHKLNNRQLYGRVTKNSRAKTERIFDYIHCQCKFKLDQLIPSADLMSHIFMGFTLCGQFFISYKEKLIEGTINLFATIEYELYIWRFVPGEKLKYISSYRIFKLLKEPEGLDRIMFTQFPTDPYKLICYGLGLANPVMAFLTILTLPTPNCKYCKTTASCYSKLRQGWCTKHGFMLHYMFSLAQPAPIFDPQVSLAYPDHVVINTGHYIHILNVSSSEPSPPPLVATLTKEEDIKASTQGSCNFADNFSEVSETDRFSTNSVVEAILEDFSEYDLEGNDCNKPFHELNISCEPLNVTGKSYHNTLVQNIVDPRLKRLQNAKECIFSMPQSSGIQKSVEKTKIDKKIAEKAYEFIEENEKYEKLSSFRKKRLADKKYEFSEDNSENIVPFNSLRKERRYLYRSQNRCIRSPDFNTSLFLSPRSPGIRSPMQSPNSRNAGQFSPGGARTLCSPSMRNSPHHSKSPISPRESARKFNVYSPILDSDCSDYESKLILRPANVSSTSHIVNNDLIRQHQHNVGLLIVDSKRDEASKWIKKVVRRYSSMDFEDSSLVSGQSRDEYNIPIEIPLIVQTLTDQQLDIVPEFKADQVTETQLIITQRTFDCEQFVQRRAQKLCSELHLEFLHCEDYDIKLLHICPIDGHIVCQAVIKIGALQLNETHSKPDVYIASCIFTWNIATDAFELIEPPDKHKLQPLTNTTQMLQIYIPPNNNKKVLVLDFDCRHSSKQTLRDYHDNFEVTLESKVYRVWQPLFQNGYSTLSDSE
ncbi:DDB1-and CUL4-substrate receptor 15, WD repeat [Popillia japonica]|uniref:DDB1-and CUL4-substrate receptor 15, WD repeat n=1 Tax=Popillia japonica TaxID=7064 RepID=A0AAW1KR76_POPJA